jgi:hypothetical protein
MVVPGAVAIRACLKISSVMRVVTSTLLARYTTSCASVPRRTVLPLACRANHGSEAKLQTLTASYKTKTSKAKQQGQVQSKHDGKTPIAKQSA